MAKPTSSREQLRCAVYTRKSTEEGLDQAFNSLDAQREACVAYILSQKHEGWTLVRDQYDDGGFSGGTMERPALKRLLADVEAGNVDVIIVYKVDRLTRSLADFAKIVEILDKRSASFVSITQAFNTTTSMGRLTLNVLLSFAQFEREVTGERIRDKVAASKAKGMWMGGNVPLGYDVKERKLIINPAEADAVRHIMQRYVALGNGRELIDELTRTGYRTKQHGNRGGNPFMRGPLFHILSNRIYLGEMVHKDVSYPGEHEAIISQELWDAVQSRMAENRVIRSRKSNAKHPSLLAGMVFDGRGRRMSPSHAVKTGKRYRYYVTPASKLTEAGPAWRVPAHDLEMAVLHAVTKLLNDRAAIADAVGDQSCDLHASAIESAEKLAALLDIPDQRHIIVEDLVSVVRLDEDHVEVDLDKPSLLARLGIAHDGCTGCLTITTGVTRIRRTKDVRLIIRNHDGRAASPPDATLVALLHEAQAALKTMLDRPHLSVKDLSNERTFCRTRFGKLLRIAMLAPDIVESCIEGTQPVSLTPKQLLNADLPIDWNDQRRELGF